MRSPCCCSVISILTLYALQRFQGILPLNPQDMSAVPADLSFNTAISFVSNTNWQTYGGESTMSYLVQMAGLTVQNFVSAADGHCARRRAGPRLRAPSAKTHRQFLGRYDPRARSTCCCRSPSSQALCFVWQGVPQNLSAYTDATTLEGAQADDRAGARGLADSHQDARHQWRRVLQRQLGASL